MEWPYLWEWPFDCINLHLRDRMVDREFNETDVRDMIRATYDVQPGEISTRYSLFARYDGSNWKIVVEPDPRLEIVIFVTAFRLERLT